jgi:hypothetical protein
MQKHPQLGNFIDKEMPRYSRCVAAVAGIFHFQFLDILVRRFGHLPHCLEETDSLQDWMKLNRAVPELLTALFEDIPQSAIKIAFVSWTLDAGITLVFPLVISLVGALAFFVNLCIQYKSIGKALRYEWQQFDKRFWFLSPWSTQLENMNSMLRMGLAILLPLVLGGCVFGAYVLFFIGGLRYQTNRAAIYCIGVVVVAVSMYLSLVMFSLIRFTCLSCCCRNATSPTPEQDSSPAIESHLEPLLQNQDSATEAYPLYEM